MAFTTIALLNEETGKVKNAPLGFSWTSLFFGWLVPLLRGDFAWSFIWLIAGIFSGFLSNILQATIYNKIYVSDLVSKGYKVKEAALPMVYIIEKVKVELPVAESFKI